MYESPRRRGGKNSPADVHDRPVPAGLHEGSYEEVLRRHERDAARAAKGTRRGRAGFARTLFPMAAHPSNHKCAIDHLASKGGNAPGPNGLRPRDLEQRERWELARAASDSIRAGTYRPGPHREVKIPKGSGRGYRPLKIQDVEDRMVQRAVLQAVQPFLDVTFLETSFGYRPDLGREHALAKAEAVARREDRWIWVLEDVRDAFEQVPHGRLLDALRHHDLPRDILDLIAVVIWNKKGRGLQQGGSLSPLLLNLYLHHHLDQPWEKAHPETPLIRYADDLLVLCRSWGEALGVKPALMRLLGPSGMPLKESDLTTTRDLGNGDVGEWLGYGLRKGEDGLIAHLTPTGWDRLDEKLAQAHAKDDAPIRAIEIIEGWIGQHGPCRRHVDVAEVYSRIVSIAHEHAFEELPTRDEARALWVRAAGRWRQLRERVRRADEGDDLSGSATAHFRPDVSGRVDGAPSSGAPSRTASPSEIAEEDEHPPIRPAGTHRGMEDHGLMAAPIPGMISR